MFNNILEISKKTSKGGRVPIKIALLKIHESVEETNKNGIHWKEEYILNNMDSAKMMPICAEFISEEKDMPLNHGITGCIVDDNGISEPVFENSETVGVIEDVAIETIKENESDIKVLVGTGYLFKQRYPNLVSWVRANFSTNKVDTSIEIMGLKENDNKIIYEEQEPSEDMRTPMVFCFSGTALLSVPPADDSAIVLEVASKNNHKKEEDQEMEFNKDEFKSAMQEVMAELNSKNEESNAKIAELNSQIADKDTVIAQKDSEICSRDEKIVELNATVEQVKKALQDLEAEREAYWAEREALQKELGELKAKQRLGELNSALEQFSDEEKKFAEVEINAFNEKPMDGDVNVIVNKIYAGIGQASKKATDTRIAEQNSAKETDIEDIFSEMCSEVHIEEEEDVNIF